MPIYEYECRGCGKVFEILQRATDAPLAECRFCHSGQVAKIISQTSFVLKGSGWYATDYAKKASAPAPSAAGKKTAETGPA